MSDEERARYLQHRAELELETKRRKQQLIASFTKVCRIKFMLSQEDYLRVLWWNVTSKSRTS